MKPILIVLTRDPVNTFDVNHREVKSTHFRWKPKQHKEYETLDVESHPKSQSAE